VWILALLAGKKAPNVWWFTYLAMLCFPISIAHLRGKRLDDIWIISETRLEHRPRVGSTTFHEPADGWAPQRLRRQKRSAHDWIIELRRPKGKRPRKVEIIIDDRQDDPVAVEAAVCRLLKPSAVAHHAPTDR